MKKFGSAVILAGGKSSRMGFDKQFMKINGNSIMNNNIKILSKEFDEIIIVTNKPEQYKDSGYKIVSDEIHERGPLSGIHAGLKNCSSNYAYFIACDMPIINMEFIKYMKNMLETFDVEACVVQTEEWFQPFNAFYSKSIINKIENSISSKSKSLFSLVKTLDFQLIKENKVKEFDENLNMFLNLNTKEDVEKYIALIERRNN